VRTSKTPNYIPTDHNKAVRGVNVLLCQEGGDRPVQSTDEIFGRVRPKDLRRSSAPGHFVHQQFHIMLPGTGSEVPRLLSAGHASFLSHSLLIHNR
jgi:hypothetical protein